jgi:DNA-binding MarR family transcriptional regulator
MLISMLLLYHHADIISRPDRRFLMQAVGYLLKTTQQSLRAAMDAALRDLRITAPQYAVLAFLDDQPDLSSAQLARRAFVTPQTMNRIVANLEAAGHLERHPHAELGRVLEARVSAQGRTLLAEARSRVTDVESRMVAGLTADEQRQLASLLQRCNSALRGPQRRRPSSPHHDSFSPPSSDATTPPGAMSRPSPSI